LSKRQVAEFVEDDEVHPGQMLGDESLPNRSDGREPCECPRRSRRRAPRSESSWRQQYRQPSLRRPPAAFPHPSAVPTALRKLNEPSTVDPSSGVRTRSSMRWLSITIFATQTPSAFFRPAKPSDTPRPPLTLCQYGFFGAASRRRFADVSISLAGIADFHTEERMPRISGDEKSPLI
jgi:hypothetical protein